MNQEDPNGEQTLLRKINKKQAQQIKRQAKKVEDLNQTVEQQSQRVMQQKQEFFENESGDPSRDRSYRETDP